MDEQNNGIGIIGRILLLSLFLGLIGMFIFMNAETDFGEVMFKISMAMIIIPILVALGAQILPIVFGKGDNSEQ